ncbi:hypothetical protein D3C83_310700 [compost metagenome]
MTRSSTSAFVNPPVISPRPGILLWKTGADFTMSLRTIALALLMYLSDQSPYSASSPGARL